jgi:RHS repeat-associated protein
MQSLEVGTAISPFGFDGSYNDRAIGSNIDYLIGRYYDPTTDQFLSVDPDVAETGQPYAFTGDDPVNETDPLGLMGTCGGQVGTCEQSGTGGHPVLVPPPVLPPAAAPGPSNPAPAVVVADEASDLSHQPQGPDSSYNEAQQNYNGYLTFGQKFYYTIEQWEGTVPIPMAPNAANLIIGFGGCYLLCFNISTQVNNLSVSFGGVGFLYRGPYVGYTGLPACKRDSTEFMTGGGYVAGVTYSSGHTTAKGHDTRDWEVDFGPMAGFELGAMHTWNLGGVLNAGDRRSQLGGVGPRNRAHMYFSVRPMAEQPL